MKRSISALFCAAAVLLTGCSNGEQNVGASTEAATSAAAASENTRTETVLNSVSEEKIMDSLNNGIIIDEVSGNVYKKEINANPISASLFCADPTAVEYNGRLYVYGTNDAQQAEQSEKNDYDKIKTLVIFSTDDMVNWIYHGKIETGEIAPWIYNSWAPSIASRADAFLSVLFKQRQRRWSYHLHRPRRTLERPSRQAACVSGYART